MKKRVFECIKLGGVAISLCGRSFIAESSPVNAIASVIAAELGHYRLLPPLPLHREWFRGFSGAPH
jgi:hypothetical protein